MPNQLLEIWQIVGQAAGFQQLLPPILEQLRHWYPVRQLLVRQFESNPPAVVTVAAERLQTELGRGDSIAENRQVLTAGQWDELHRWHAESRPLALAERSPESRLSAVFPPVLAGSWVAISFGDPASLVGALLLELDLERPLERPELEFLQLLSGPLLAAFRSDQQYAELKRLAQKAEQDRLAALRRNGRADLPDRVVGERGGLRVVMERVGLVTDSDVPVLILGETGTGKEVVSKAIHTRGPRRDGPFIRVNCGAIPPELIDAQLFGHEKGSFTGAEQSRMGWFERADGGTLFLDEIGELPLEAQVRFLRVLQDGFIERVGGRQPIHIDVRIIAATHRDLAAMVKDRTFREDLWYRLAVFPIRIPPLRERREDMEELATYLAERAAIRFSLAPCRPSPTDIELLRQYRWPGNIRELGAVMDRAAILGEGKSLDLRTALGFFSEEGQGHAPETTAGRTFAAAAGRAHGEPKQDWSLDNAMRVHIERVLQLTQGRIEGPHGAAVLLRINPHTLRARMRKLHIDWSDFRRDNPGAMT